MTAESPLSEDQPQGHSMLMWLLGVGVLILPILGVLAHVAMYFVAINPTWGPEWWTTFVHDDGMKLLADYRHGWGLKIVALLGFLTLVGSWFHYSRTGMPISLIARIVTYLWLLSMILVWKIPVGF